MVRHISDRTVCSPHQTVLLQEYPAGQTAEKSCSEGDTKLEAPTYTPPGLRLPPLLLHVAQTQHANFSLKRLACKHSSSPAILLERCLLMASLLPGVASLMQGVASSMQGVASSMQGVASLMAAAKLSALGSVLGSGLAAGSELLVGSPTS